MIPKKCPIELTLSKIGKKWTINIIRDLMFGKKRFKEFLEANPELSTKMLSERLKELESDDLVVKRIVNKSPIIIEYSLTKKGKNLNRILYELAMYSINNDSEELIDTPEQRSKIIRIAKQFLNA